MWVPYASTCTGSSRPADARPVRSPPNSCFSNWIAPCMRRLSSFMSCVGLAMATLECVGALPRACRLRMTAGELPTVLIADDGGASFSAQNRRDRSLFADREHDDRHPVFLGKREGGGIHHFQVALDRLLVGQTVVALRRLILFGIGAVHPVDVGGLEHRVGTDFSGPQDGRGVGRKEGIASTGGEHQHPTFVEMAKRAWQLVGLGDLGHRKCGHGSWG